MKKKCIDSYLLGLHIDKGKPKPIIGYGNARFNQTDQSRGRSVPIKGMKKRCQQFYQTVEVDEYRTSQVCPNCDSTLGLVNSETRRGRNGNRRIVRGLLHCNNQQCAWKPFKSRDGVAAKNFLRCFEVGATTADSVHRRISLCRGEIHIVNVHGPRPLTRTIQR